MTARRDWHQTTLGAALPIRYGKARTDKAGVVREESPVYGSSGVIGKFDRALTNGPTLIIGRKGTVGATHYSAGPCWPIDTVYFAEESKDKDLPFFKYLLDHLQLGRMDRSTAVPGLSRDDYNAKEVAIPDIDEQQRIVAEIEKQFTRLDAAVALLKRVQTALKRYRASVLKAACEGRLVPTEAELARKESRGYQSGDKLLLVGDAVSERTKKKRRARRLWGAGHVPELTEEERSRLPIGWAWAKVRDLGSDSDDTVQVGPMSMQSRDFRDDGVPVLNVGCVQWGYFDESKLNYLPTTRALDFSRYRIQAGDILFTRSGTVGRCAVAQARQNGWLMTFHLLRARPNPQKCLPDFLRIVFEGAPHIRRQARVASVGSTRAGFNTNLLANLAVPLPPLAEQHRIIAEVERLLSVIEELEAVTSTELQRALRLRQSILRRAFSM
jgi:type I restriction enzyme S subunit